MPLLACITSHLGSSAGSAHKAGCSAITIGASQALFLSLQTLLSPGDEVLLIEPFFDLYLGQIRLAGGTPVFVPLSPQEDGSWYLHKP